MSMFKRIEQRFGTAGLIVAVVALVAALGGSAYALTGAEKKQITKESKKWSKKFSKRFAKPGPAGAPGANGLPGAAGNDGTPGTNGTNGTNGADGKTVLNGTATPTAGVGTLGDFYIETDVSKIYGPKASSGANGGWGTGTDLKGAPWTAGGTLPSGETLTGAYAHNTSAAAGPEVLMSENQFSLQAIDFSIPLASDPSFVFVPGVPGAEGLEGDFGSNPGAGCPGVTAAGVPQADPGTLCVYGMAVLGFGPIPSATVTAIRPSSRFAAAAEAGASPAGTILRIKCEAEFCLGNGTWAVSG